jgi:uncharacterized protein YfcZ (UPF0381/DUF406 family)
MFNLAKDRKKQFIQKASTSTKNRKCIDVGMIVKNGNCGNDKKL